jgi:hypothetical protein
MLYNLLVNKLFHFVIITIVTWMYKTNIVKKHQYNYYFLIKHKNLNPCNYIISRHIPDILAEDVLKDR